MQFVEISRNTTLANLRDLVGGSNVEQVLANNALQRTPNVGAQLYQRQEEIVRSSKSVSLDYKINTLNRFSSDSEIFENAALMNESGWKILKTSAALPGTMYIADDITLPSSTNVIGNSSRVSDKLFQKVMSDIKKIPHIVDPEDFNTYSSKKATKVLEYPGVQSKNTIFEFAKIPWGNMTIYSSIANESMDFPVYPEEIPDNAKANYTTMPELIYQYEPWQLYTSSGPRAVSYNFTFHRDMWTGDHRDGMANKLVRFCMANCYPEYNGSAVNSALTTLYMNGEILIRGVLTDVTVTWDGPLGLDNFYLVCKLTLTLIEVSPYPLDYWTMKNKPLIG